MIGTNENVNFLAETEAEESLMLMGKVNALRGIWAVMPDQIDAKMINAIFCFGADAPEEIKKAEEQVETYRKWYYEELIRANNLLDEKKVLEEKLKEKEKEEDGNTL